jgi:DNA polymerase III subunit gamma/tau
MAYEVFARKWRPQTFSTVIGQEHITSTLANAVEIKRLAHAYLFSGPRGVGKTSVARILAKAMNCTATEGEVPCNQCTSCKEITDGSSVDVQEIDGASNRGIDEIRDLRDGIKYMPSSSTYRIYIIDEVHMLTLPAFNALLKTLEEPPPHVKFIFATTEPQKVPITILSRCQRFDFKRIPRSLIASHLREMAAREGIEISDAALQIIAGESEGSMRDAESLLDQVVSSAGTKVEDDQLYDILGVIDRNVVNDAAEAILKSETTRCLELVEEIYVRGYDIKEFYHSMMAFFRDLLVIRIAPDAVSSDMPAEEKKALLSQASLATVDKLQVLLDFLIAREETIRFSSTPRLILEATMIRMCRIDDYLSLEEIIEKLDGLSGKPESLNAPSSQRREVVDDDVPAKTGESPLWEDFLVFLKTRQRGVYNVLKDWSVKSFSGDMVELIKGGRAFTGTYFDDRETMAQLETLCTKFFNRRVSIRILESDESVPSSGGNEGSKIEQKNAQRAPVARELEKGDPAGDILRIFHGQVNADTRRKNQEITPGGFDSGPPDREEDES